MPEGIATPSILIQTERYSPSSLIQHYNYIANTQESFDTGWHDNAADSAFLNTIPDAIKAIIFMRLPLQRFIQLVADVSESYINNATQYRNFRAQERVYGQRIRVYPWYGIVQINVITRNTLAIRFDGRGPESFNFVGDVFLQQRVLNHNAQVIYTHTPQKLQLFSHSAGLEGWENFPEQNSGTIREE